MISPWTLSNLPPPPPEGFIGLARDLVVCNDRCRLQAKECCTAYSQTQKDRLSYHIISYHIISYHIISYHIISYHIISYHTGRYCGRTIVYASRSGRRGHLKRCQEFLVTEEGRQLIEKLSVDANFQVESSANSEESAPLPLLPFLGLKAGKHLLFFPGRLILQCMGGPFEWSSTESDTTGLKQ